MMNKIISIACLLVALSFSSFGQNVNETDFSIGLNSPTHFKQDALSVVPMPSNLIFNATKSWYNTGHWISLRKELGLNLQYLKVRYGIGDLERDNYFTGNIVSLFADAALLAHIRIFRTMAFSIGPEAEFLLLGSNNVNHSTKSPQSPLPYKESTNNKGINRDYFNQPTYGIKARLFESDISKKATIGLVVSYLWTKHEYFNFNTTNYTRLGIYIGFKKQKEEAPVELVN